jgi:hypothetical protein
MEPKAIEPTSMPYIIIENGVEYYPQTTKLPILPEVEVLPPPEGGE